MNLESSKADLSFLAQKFSLFKGWKIYHFEQIRTQKLFVRLSCNEWVLMSFESQLMTNN